MERKEVRADVLVVGGALTGLWAAIAAKEARPELEVLLVDKATAGKSGCAAFAGGDITCVWPEDNLEELEAIYLREGAGLADQGWLEFVLKESGERVRQMAEWGVPFERTPSGQLVRKGGRGGGALSAVSSGRNMLSYMQRAALKHGVRFVNRTMVTDLLVEDGAVRGAAGFDVETAQPCVFQAGAVVLVAGPCSFKATYIGHRMATGDGLAAAYRHGAQVAGMEFAVAHNTGPRDYDISGMARFVAMGGRFTNALGEEFMWRYDLRLGNKANWSALLMGMAKEVQEGRGPVYFDMSLVNDEDYELSRKILAHTFLALDRAGVDLRREKVEWVACFAGNRASAGGLRLNREMAATIPGLFTGGDTSTKPHYGANAGYHGMNFAWCAASGYHAGRSAARWAAREKGVAVSPRVAAEALDCTMSPLGRPGGPTPDEAIEAIQEAIIPYQVVILKDPARMRRALEAVSGLSETVGEIRAGDGHDLVKAHEAVNMQLVGEMILRASLLRAESRGVHHRVDYPERDDANWQAWLCLQKKGKGMDFWLEGNGGEKKVLPPVEGVALL